jgi:hypothetical protein
MSLCSLPPEVIVHITTFLFSDEIDVLAQTLNSSITRTCLSLLNTWTPKARNARKMTALFGRPASWENTSMKQIFPADLGEYSPPSDDPVLRLRTHQLLNLSESLHWLPCELLDVSAPLTDVLGWCAEGTAALERAQQHLGLEFEPAFRHFINSEKHQHIFNTFYSEDGYDWAFRIGPMIKIVTSTSTGLSDVSQGSMNGYGCQFAVRSMDVHFR